MTITRRERYRSQITWITFTMGRRLENLEQFGIRVVSNVVMAFEPPFYCGILDALPSLTSLVVQLRLYFYRKRICASARLGVLVISVGNLTVEAPARPRSSKKLIVVANAGVEWQF